MHCLRCRRDNPVESRFCVDCGARLVPACPACGTDLPPGSRFCNQCGARVDGPGDVAARFPSPEAYTPRDLAARIVDARAALEGERKQVTVLFADMKDSLLLLADRDPEDARKILDPVLEQMIEAVHRFEGMVNQVMGDGIMALFGAPLAHEDHAVRACYAALRMQESVRRHAESTLGALGVPVQIRVGLHSGEVVVRAINSDLRMDYTAVGQTTHLAARMEQLAPPGGILMTADTVRLAHGFVEARKRGRVSVKGLLEPVEVYDLHGVTPARSRLQSGAARGLTTFVGRAVEMERLTEALERARAGRGQIVGIVGEPGVGKSRLCWELARSSAIRDWRVLQATAVAYERTAPYAPVIEVLKAYFEVDPRDPAVPVRDQVTTKLRSLDPSLEPTAPAFLELFDVPVDSSAWIRLDPLQRRRQTLDGVIRLLLRESAVQPLLLVFEDLQWIDSESQSLFDSLVDSLTNARVLLLVTYRPDYWHGWSGGSAYTQLTIEPLPHDSAHALLDELIGRDPLLDPLKGLLISRTDGNPFFLEEMARTLVEMQVLSGERGSYRVTRDLSTIEIPATVQAVLAARIDGLPAEEKRLLQCAAVVGRDVPLALLQAVTDANEDTLRHLKTLQSAEFLYETRLFPEPEWSFKHALTHEVAYGGLLHDRRRALHRRIVETLEGPEAGRETEQVELLSHHALRGELWDKAVRFLRQAGRRAASRSAHTEAVVRFEQALATLHHVPRTRDVLELGIDLRLDLRNSLHPLGDLGRILRHLEDAEALATELDDRRRLGRVFSFMTQYFRLTGDLDRAIAAGHRAVAIADHLQDRSLWIAANAHLGPAYGFRGEYRTAVQILRANVDALPGPVLPEGIGSAGLLSVFSRIYLVSCLAELGEFPEGIAQGGEGIRIAESANHQYSLIFACFGLGTLFVVKGEIPRAVGLLERGLGLARALNLPIAFPLLASSLGSAYAWSGRLTEGKALLEEAVSQAVATSRIGGHSMIVARLGEACWLAGRADQAATLAAQALELAVEKRERGHQAHAFRLLADIAAGGDPVDVPKAEAAYHEALAISRELGMRPLEAHCQLGLGRLLCRAGRRESAVEPLAGAVATFDALGMTRWLEPARAELATARGEDQRRSR